MFSWLFSKSLDSALSATRTCRVEGVLFKIKKISVLDNLEGMKVLFQYYDTYKKDPTAAINENNQKKLKQHYTDVFMAGVVEPKLTRDPEQKDGGVYVEKLFSDWTLVNGLYENIVDYTYGKKKAIKAASR